MLPEKLRKKLACNCHNVSYGKIYDAVKAGAKTWEEVSKITGASTGCGKCKEFVEHLVRDFLQDVSNL